MKDILSTLGLSFLVLNVIFIVIVMIILVNRKYSGGAMYIFMSSMGIVGIKIYNMSMYINMVDTSYVILDYFEVGIYGCLFYYSLYLFTEVGRIDYVYLFTLLLLFLSLNVQSIASSETETIISNGISHLLLYITMIISGSRLEI